MKDENKKILYIARNYSYFNSIHKLFVEDGGEDEGVFYNDNLIDKLQQPISEEVSLEGIIKFVEENNGIISTIIVDGSLNKDVGILFKLKEKGLSDKILTIIYPIYPISGKTASEAVALSGAKFGLSADVIHLNCVLGNIVNKKLGGYVFNPTLYKEKDGTLVTIK